MRDSHRPIEIRLRAAAEAAAYVHPRMPQAITVGGEIKVEGVRVEIVGLPPEFRMPPVPAA